MQLQPAALFARAGFYPEIKAQRHTAYCLNEGDLKVGASDVFLKENRDTPRSGQLFDLPKHIPSCAAVRTNPGGFTKAFVMNEPLVSSLSVGGKGGKGWGAGWGGLIKKQDKYLIFFWYGAEEAAELQKKDAFRWISPLCGSLGSCSDRLRLSGVYSSSPKNF